MKTKWSSWAPGAVLLAGILWALAVLNAGCTITPKPVLAPDAGYSGNSPYAGVLGVDARGVRVTGPAFARYAALVGRYGKGQPEHPFLPALTVSAGTTALPDGSYVVDKEHFADWTLMATWAREGRTP